MAKRLEVMFPATSLEHTERSSALCSSLVPTIERRPSQPASHAVALAGPMFHRFPFCAVEVSEAIICVRAQPPRSIAYMTAFERIACDRAQPSDLAAFQFSINRTLNVNFRLLRFLNAFLLQRPLFGSAHLF
jgi:hypothetical protein